MSRKAGRLEFRKDVRQWREADNSSVSRHNVEEIRRRARGDGFHAGFILGAGLMNLPWMIGVIIGFWT